MMLWGKFVAEKTGWGREGEDGMKANKELDLDGRAGNQLWAMSFFSYWSLITSSLSPLLYREVPGVRAFEKGPRTIEEIAQEVATFFGLEESQLYRRYASVSGARAIFIELSCLYMNRHMSLSEIGRRVGNVSAAALSQQRKRLAVKMQNDHQLKACFEELKKRWE
jgi:hypothetical protein